MFCLQSIFLPMNPYAKKPLRVALGGLGAPTTLLVFVGDAPPPVLRGVEKALSGGGGKGVDAVLQGHFGAGWRAALGLAGKAGGDAFDDFGDLDDFDDLDALAAPPTPPIEPPSARSTKKALKVVASSLQVYPEDSLDDLAAKVHAATGVPAAQLFFPQRPQHVLTRGGAPVDPALDELGAPAPGRTPVAGVYVEPLEADRDVLYVRARGHLAMLGAPRPDPLHCVACWEVLAPGAARAALNDTLMGDLLWYGVVMRYWPRMDRAALRRGPAPTALSRADTKEAERVARAQQPAMDAAHDSRAVGKPVAHVRQASAVGAVEGRLILRNVFDVATAPPTSGRSQKFLGLPVEAAEVLFWAPGWYRAALGAPRAAPARLRAGARPPGAASDELFAAFAPPSRDVATLTLRLTPRRYEVTARWAAPAPAPAAEKFLAAQARALVAAINGLGGATGGGAARLPAAGLRHMVGFVDIPMPVLPSAAGAADAAREVAARRWGALAEAGLLAGAAATPTRLVARARKGVMGGYAPGALQQSVELSGDLVDSDYSLPRERRDAVHPGRPVTAERMVKALRVGAEDVTASEFAWLQRLLGAALAAPEDLDRELAAAARAARKASRLDRLQQIDPALYDLKKHDPSSVVYARLCQGTERQPLILGPGDKPKKGDAEYWNFTEGAPATYRCTHPDFPALGFLGTDKHPKGFCLPCCKRAPAAPGTAAAARDAACLAREAPAGAPAKAASRLLAASKAVPFGREGQLPPALAAIMGKFGEPGAVRRGAGSVGRVAAALGVDEAGATLEELALAHRAELEILWVEYEGSTPMLRGAAGATLGAGAPAEFALVYRPDLSVLAAGGEARFATAGPLGQALQNTLETSPRTAAGSWANLTAARLNSLVPLAAVDAASGLALTAGGRGQPAVLLPLASAAGAGGLPAIKDAKRALPTAAALNGALKALARAAPDLAAPAAARRPVRLKDRIIGFAFEGRMFFHAPVKAPKRPAANTVAVAHHPLDVAAAAPSDDFLPAGLAKAAAAAQRANAGYRLYLAEFAHAIRGSRAVSKPVRDLAWRPRAGAAPGPELAKALAGVYRKHGTRAPAGALDADLAQLRAGQRARAEDAGSRRLKTDFLWADLAPWLALAGGPVKEATRMVRAAMDKRVSLTKSPAMDNVFVACADAAPGAADSHCSGGRKNRKLLLTAEERDTYLALLAQDLANPAVNAARVAAAPHGVVDPLAFAGPVWVEKV